MAESDFTKVGYSLTIDGKYYNTLDIESFSLMMKDPSYCYKFYWLEAIVQLISEGVKETTFDARKGTRLYAGHTRWDTYTC